MARCASCRRISRSAGEYSAGTERTDWLGGCNIGRFAPSRKNKRTPAAAFGTPVNFLPEAHEIIDRRNQRQGDHEPDGHLGDEIDTENEVKRPVIPFSVPPAH